MHSSEWQYGYRELVDQVEVLRAEYPDLPVYITREQGRPAMYYWFYTQTDPTLVQAVNDVAKKDQGEFLEFENIRFVRSLTEVTSTPAIVAGSPGQVSQLKIGKELGAINNLADVPVWQLAIVE
jgi:hypothetical protein